MFSQHRGPPRGDRLPCANTEMSVIAYTTLGTLAATVALGAGFVVLTGRLLKLTQALATR